MMQRQLLRAAARPVRIQRRTFLDWMTNYPDKVRRQRLLKTVSGKQSPERRRRKSAIVRDRGRQKRTRKYLAGTTAFSISLRDLLYGLEFAHKGSELLHRNTQGSIACEYIILLVLRRCAVATGL
jgi:hypothetical protein